MKRILMLAAAFGLGFTVALAAAILATLSPTARGDASALLFVLLVMPVFWRPALLGGALGVLVMSVFWPAAPMARARERSVALICVVVIEIFLMTRSPAAPPKVHKPNRASDLIAAVVDRDVARVRALVDGGADVNALAGDRTALTYALDLQPNEEIGPARHFLMSGNLLFLLPRRSRRSEIIEILRNRGAIARDSVASAIIRDSAPKSAVRLTRLDASPKVIGFGTTLQVSFAIANTGNTPVTLPHDRRFDPPDALLGRVELSFYRHTRKEKSPVAQVPGVIVWSPSERLAPGQEVSVQLTISQELSPGAVSLEARLWPNDPANPESSTALDGDMVVQGSADAVPSFCTEGNDLRLRIEYAIASVQPGQLSTLVAPCPDAKPNLEQFRLGVIAGDSFRSMIDRLRDPSGRLDEPDVHALEDAAQQILKFEQTSRERGGIRPPFSFARGPLGEVVRGRDRHRRGGPARSLDRFAPVIAIEGSDESLPNVVDILSKPAGQGETIDYNARDIAVLEQLVARASSSGGASKGVIEGIEKQVAALAQQVTGSKR